MGGGKHARNGVAALAFVMVFAAAAEASAAVPSPLTVPAEPSEEIGSTNMAHLLQAQAGDYQAVHGFSDVPNDHFAAAAIATLEFKGTFFGTECGGDFERFCPDEPLKRWELAVWIVRVLERPISSVSLIDGRYDPEDPWWEGDIDRLVELGVTKGCDVNPWRFCPTDTVTRAQMAAFLDRAFDLPQAPDAGFVDTAGVFSKDSIDRLYHSGITQGCDDSPLRYCPSDTLTRGQAAVMLHRARYLVDMKITVHYCGPPGFTEEDLQGDIDKLQPVADFFERESGGKSTVTFTKGNILVPPEANSADTWDEMSLEKFRTMMATDPCRKALIDTTTIDLSRYHTHMILADVQGGGGFGLGGFVVMQTFGRHTLPFEKHLEDVFVDRLLEWIRIAAHEIGHAAYDLGHSFENFWLQGGTDKVIEQCRYSLFGLLRPNCQGPDELRLEHLAGSIMSYVQYGAYLALADSYISCLQKKWLGWYKGICGLPGALPAAGLEAGDGSITVHLSPPDPGWAPIDSYNVHLTWADGALTVPIPAEDANDGGGVPVFGLDNHVQYSVRVAAVNEYGTGERSLPAHIAPQEFPPGVPTVPSVRAVARRNTLEASWSASDNSAPIDQWEIEGVGTVSAAATSYTWPSPSLGEHHIRVRAHNQAGWSPWGRSNTVTIQRAYDAGSAVNNRRNWNPQTNTLDAECAIAKYCHNIGVSNLSDFGNPPYHLKCRTETSTKTESYNHRYWDGDPSWSCYFATSEPHTVHVIINGHKANAVRIGP